MGVQVEIAGRCYSYQECSEMPLGEFPEFAREAVLFIKKWIQGARSWTVSTSGSTGKPKEISISRERMIASAEATIEYFNWNSEDVFWLVLSAEYIGGKMLLARALLLNASIIISEASRFCFSESTILSPTISSIVPLQIDDLQWSITNNPKLSKLKTVIIGGAALSDTQLEIAKSIPIEMYQTYGMTETVSHIALRNVKWPNSKGYEILAGIETALDDKNCLKIKAEVTGGEWILTNDVVALPDSKHIKFLYRYDDVVVSGGIKIPLHELEQKIALILTENFKMNGPFFCFGLPQETLGECACICFQTEPKVSLAEVISILKSSLPKYWSPKRYFVSAIWPLTASGKLIRKNVDIKTFTEWL